MPEILVLPSPATRRTYPLHLRIVCALVARLADLQVSLQHAHTARLVRNFPARYAPVERMQVQRDGDQIKVVDILAEQDGAHNLPPVNESRPVFSGVSRLGELIQAQLSSGSQPIFTPVTQEEEDFARMRAEVAQLMEDALSNTTAKRGTSLLKVPRKENPNA